MKNKILYTITLFCLIVTSCHQPDELLPPVARNGINSITVSFLDGSGEFTTIIEEGVTDIVIDIPYYYPVESTNRVTDDMIVKMRARANLDDNVILEPALLFLDLTKTNHFTVINQKKERIAYTVRGNIKKSDACLITDFKVPMYGLSGVINDVTNTISLIAPDDISTPAVADVSVSFHATISPDPSVTPLNYQQEQQFTVTAHDGVTTKTYTVKKEIPEKLPFGIRSGSAKQLFAKKLDDDLGISTLDITRGLSLSDGYLILNSSGQNSTYINALTGEKMGTMELGTVKGEFTNFYATSDDDGNILICNRTPDDGNTFKIWRKSSVEDPTIDLLLEYPTSRAMGTHFSINGSVDGNAIITAPFYGTSASRSREFARWTVVDGALSSATPEIVSISGFLKNNGEGWTTTCDVISTSNTNVNADYFMHSYSEYLCWVNGSTNAIRSKVDYSNNNFVGKSVDFIEFNGAKYAAIDWTNTQTWGSADIVFLLDVTSSGKFSGNLETQTVEAVVWQEKKGVYGARSINPTIRGNYADVLLSVSDHGYYMYLYFVFTNGYVVGYQFDCVMM